MGRQTLGWNPAARYRLDVAEFEAAAAGRNIPSLQAAVERYTGDLLPDFYDDWLAAERERLRGLFEATLERLAGLLEAGGRTTEAIAAAGRLARLDPLDEARAVHLIRLHALNGDRAGARRAYGALADVLRQELGVEPDRETRAAYEEWLAYGPPAASARRTNLPAQLSSFIGRAPEVAEVIRLIGSSRLVTLTGAGGSGKTRLALEVAAQLNETFPGGVWFVDLAPLDDPALVTSVVAAAVGMVEDKTRPLLDSLADFLSGRQALLLFDNCEHLVAEAACVVDQLLRRVPELRILTTSREPLGVAGESVWLAPTLSLPPPDEQTIEGLERYDAVRLFAERASAALPAFRLTGGNAAAVAQLCRRLDGLPLAIELAAARVKLLRVEQIVARLDDRFRLLAGGSRAAPARHQTLRALIDWSHDLLSPVEQRLLRRLSVFAGGFALEAAEAIGDVENEGEVLDILTQLVNKSLITARRVSGQQTRYDLHETIRQYAGEKLVAAGEVAAMQARHADYYSRLLEAALPRFHYDDRVLILQDWVEMEYENWRAIMSRSLDDGVIDPAWGIRVAARLAGYWLVHSRMVEGRRWLEAALDRAAGASPAVRAYLYTRQAEIIIREGDSQTMPLAAEALALFRQVEDREGIVRATVLMSLQDSDTEQARDNLEQILPQAANLGLDIEASVHFALMMVGTRAGDMAFAVDHCEKSLAIRRELGQRINQAELLGTSGHMYRRAGAHARASAVLLEGLDLMRSLHVAWREADILNSLGENARLKKDYVRADSYYREGLASTREMGQLSKSAFILSNLGDSLIAQGDLRQATAVIQESMNIIRRENRVNDTLLWDNYLLARIAEANGDVRRAARLHGAANILKIHTSILQDPKDVETLDAHVARVRARLGDAAYAAAWAEGQRMSLEEMYAYALEMPNLES